MPKFIWKRKRKYLSMSFNGSKGKQILKENKVARILINKKRQKILIAFQTQFLKFYILDKISTYDIYFIMIAPVIISSVRTYVIHLLGTYVTTLCNWLIL